jgi:hypothetical protein
MVICPKCNTENTEDAKFCMKCGVSLTSEETRKPIMSDFRIALLATIIPIIAISVTSAVLGALVTLGTDFGWILWWLAVGLWGIAFIIAIIFGVRHKRSIASGIWVGIAISVIVLGTTCFVNIGNTL